MGQVSYNIYMENNLGNNLGNTPGNNFVISPGTRTLKRTIAIIEIVLAAFSIISGIMLIAGNSLFAGMFVGALGDEYYDLAGLVHAMAVVAGVIVIGLGAMFLFFAIKMLSSNPNRGIAITLLVFAYIAAIDIFTFSVYGIIMGLVNLALVIMLHIYLARLKNEQEQFALSNQPPIIGGMQPHAPYGYDQNTGLPIQAPYPPHQGGMPQAPYGFDSQTGMPIQSPSNPPQQ